MFRREWFSCDLADDQRTVQAQFMAVGDKIMAIADETKPSAVSQRRAKSAERKQRYPGLHKALSLSSANPATQRDAEHEARRIAEQLLARYDTPSAPPLLRDEAQRQAEQLLAPYTEVQRKRLMYGEWIDEPRDQRPQGATMSSPDRCGNPGCAACYPRKASPDDAVRSETTPAMEWRRYSPGDINVSIDWQRIAKEFAKAFNVSASLVGPYENKEQPMSNNGNAQRALNAVHDLEASELPIISKAVKDLQDRNKARVVQNLRGVVDLATMATPKGAPFVLAYWVNDEVVVLQGVDYARGQYIEEKREGDKPRVFIEGNDYPVSGAHFSMRTLKTLLDARDLPYHLAYFDED